MIELVSDYEEILVIIYCLIILEVNVSFIKDYKNIKRGLGEISSENELEINPNSLSLMLIGSMFNFFRRWLLYILAITITGNIFVGIASIILFIISLYDSIFNSSLEKVKTKKVSLYLAGLDVIYACFFIIYLFAV